MSCGTPSLVYSKDVASYFFLEPAFLDHFGGRKSEDFAENPLPRISMFTSSRCWSDFGRISQQIRGFQIDYECGLIGKIWLNMGICQTLGFSILKMSRHLPHTYDGVTGQQ
jgi:hypothetical protein